MDQAFQVILSKTFLKSRKGIPESYQNAIDDALDNISKSPFSAPQIKKLSGYNNLYRYRVGSYRIVYDIKDTIRVVNVVDIGHRKDVYR